MNTIDFSLPLIERSTLALRKLYEQYGYKRYKMSKFEEYGLYLENKSFLPASPIITFSDFGGKLLALKPDVTLSIAKNADTASGEPQKVYYNENVYRVPRGGTDYGEIAQVGLECLGKIDPYSQCEVFTLACKSLACLSESYVMTLSHMGYVSGLLQSCDLPLTTEEKILNLIEQKNAHEIRRLCETVGVRAEKCEALVATTRLCGAVEETLERAAAYVCNEKMSDSLNSIKNLYQALPIETEKDSIRLDFSVINDLSYYNGIIFQGFVPEVPRAVLAGGRYDKLMERLGKKSGAMGFAVYISELEHLESVSAFDVDILLLYDRETTAKTLMETMQRLTKQGKSVRAQSNESDKIKYRELMDLREGRQQT